MRCPRSCVARYRDGFGLIPSDPAIHDACDSRAQQRRQPEQPQLRQRPAAHEHGRACAARRIHRRVGDGNADEVNECEAQTDGNRCEAFGGIAMSGPQDHKQKPKGHDEFSHQDFLNAFLVKMRKNPVDLERFRTLSSSPAAPVQAPRLTNLMHLNVDTSWYLKYRSSGNPDFGDTFEQVVDIVDRPAVPVQDQSLYTEAQIQAIANTAAFHFPMIEQGGASLYDALSLNCTSLLALRIVASIGGAEVAHFAIWHDAVGNIPAVDSGNGLVFPDLEASEETDPALVMPKPCKFISADLPLCSVIRPTSPRIAGARAAVQFLTDTGLFVGQSAEFFDFISGLAAEADKAGREQERD